MVSKVIALTLPGQGGTEPFHSRGHRYSLGDSSLQGVMLLGQQDREGHAARLGLRARLESDPRVLAQLCSPKLDLAPLWT